MRSFVWLHFIAAVALSSAIVMAQQDTANEPANEEKAAIAEAIQSYEAAFNARDVKTLASHWSQEGVYTSRLSGEQIVGRTALQKEFTSLFAEIQDTKLKLATQSIDFVSPNVAVEQGRATVIHPDAELVTSGYSVVYVKRDGKWLIDWVSEEEEPPAALSHYEQLKDLEWMIGQWVDQAGGISTVGLMKFAFQTWRVTPTITRRKIDLKPTNIRCCYTISTKAAAAYAMMLLHIDTTSSCLERNGCNQSRDRNTKR